MFFEGSEKKVEILVHNEKLSLLNDVSDAFWAELVIRCNAKILSSIRNAECKAFLLSESSLFVWDNYFLILTCGETNLVNSVEYFIEQLGVDTIKHLTYQRKNEYYAHAQPSCFGDDVKRLTKYIPGKAMRFGAMDSHHNFIFHQDNDFKAATDDKTYEIFAYQICHDASNHLTRHGLAANDIREFLKLEQLIPDFQLDDFVFQPYGYSVNAIRGRQYLTIHVTPQADSSYISFESNVNLIDLLPIILDVLKPSSFDLLCYNETQFQTLTDKSVPQDYVSQSLVQQKLTNGFLVNFANYILPTQQFTQATVFEVDGENHEL
ncbi:adenosylmethionine decarboxylase [Psychrobium sp. 1_MG-2023]|uniref:adenosylmethionine decarboxylase n=1 Tax=Psychrobium sp. 1_MG-2023 TaxID=3062624 RepID=UPI000C32733E|nr:adenosylmethionine decarboxylase [Psychrobium sp. 1_MG-2023]MDP2561520.1 adenosylmethionine decarboxylase [Psychrobium sp. 1_MG-2023]PKF54985.1 adenosylmethionine decarboxylase [Alteromonadales bacterium alter-6D02]